MEEPYMLAGNDAVSTASRYLADKCFFSTSDVSRDGEMSYEGDIYPMLHKVMIRNSKKSFYLMNKEKVDRGGGRVKLGDFSLVDHVISDYEFDTDIRQKYPNVDFIVLEQNKE